MSKLIFKQTNLTCPEVYEVIWKIDDVLKHVGLVSLRFGKLTAFYLSKDIEPQLIYEAFIGDEWTGRFTDYEERLKHFEAIEKKIFEMMEEK